MAGLCLIAAGLRAGEIHDAAVAGDLARVTALLEADAALLESKDRDGFTPLISACFAPPSFAPRVDVANFLIERGADVMARNNWDGTPLYCALRSPELIQRLIDKGADVNARAFGANGLTPLQQAAAIGELETAKLLIAHGAELNARSSDGTILHHVIKSKSNTNQDMVKLLLEGGARLQNFSFSNTELHLAALEGSAEVARLLVAHGADVNAANDYGHTPLFYAARHYQLILFELSFRYAARTDWTGLLALFQKAQAEGLFFPLQPGPRARPPYVVELAKLDGFDAWLRENDRLRTLAEKSARLEYAIEKPAGYASGRKYPLVIVLHGGAGCSAAMAERWQSARLRSDCLVAFVQGGLLRGSFSRAFADDNFASLRAAYAQIQERYPVDTERVILAGQSNGGRASIQLVAGDRIPVRGLILAFPTKPADLIETSLRDAAGRGVRAVFFCGERDEGFAAQQEMRALFERSAVPTLFRSFPEKGHELPDNFPERIDEALAFLFEASP